MTADSERLLAVARLLEERCPPELGSEIAVTGSVGAGLADAHSDLELLFLCETVPSPERVAAWLRAVGAADVLAGEEADGVWGWCRLDGVELDPFWAPLAAAERELDEITSGRVLEHERLAFAHVVLHSIAVRTSGALAGLARRCASYPAGLARRLIEDCLAKWEIPAPRLGTVLRGDVVSAAVFAHRGAQHVLRVVFALNERWEPPRWKWVRVYADELVVAPPRLVDRVEEALLAPGLAGAHALAELTRDVVALVPPEIGSSAARASSAARLAAIEAALERERARA